MKPADANTWINVIISGICLGPLLVPQQTFLGKGNLFLLRKYGMPQENVMQFLNSIMKICMSSSLM